MENFFEKVDKANTNASYHNPFKYFGANKNSTRSSKRMGDVFTTLWLETAGLVSFMSLVVLLPTFFRVMG